MQRCVCGALQGALAQAEKHREEIDALKALHEKQCNDLRIAYESERDNESQLLDEFDRLTLEFTVSWWCCVLGLWRARYRPW